jgi:hypothetical protein
VGSDGHITVIAAIDAATAELAELCGSKPHLVYGPKSVRIEVEVTRAVATRWERLLAVLESGTTFGLTDTAAGRTAWVVFAW